MPTFTPAQLVDAGTRIFTACGVPESDAVVVSESLVESNLLGHDSHGVIRIPSYVTRVKEGHIAAGVGIAVVRESPASAVLDGQWGFGQIMARQAMQFAIDRAKSQSVAVVTMHRSNHIGRLGEYSAIAAQAGLIGIIMSNNHGAGQLVAPWGGRQARMAPTPISICAPSEAGNPVLMDITTAVVAEGKVRVAKNRGQKLPEGVILNADGEPTTDPNELYGPPRGVILPFGGIVGHKGYTLGFMIEILAGILSGASASCADPVQFGNAVFIAAVNIESFMPLAEFQRKVQEFIVYVKSSATVPGVGEIYFPGEKEYRERRKRLENGIFVEHETWDQIRETARGLDVELDA